MDDQNFTPATDVAATTLSAALPASNHGALGGRRTRVGWQLRQQHRRLRLRLRRARLRSVDQGLRLFRVF